MTNQKYRIIRSLKREDRKDIREVYDREGEIIDETIDPPQYVEYLIRFEDGGEVWVHKDNLEPCGYIRGID